MKFIISIIIASYANLVFAQARIEDEYKIEVPQEKVAEVWEYLKDLPAILSQDSQEYSAKLSDEYFTDIYFDTAEFELLNKENCVRRRIRSIPENPADRKHGRSLIQIKLKRTDANQTSRSEIKYNVKEEAKNLPYSSSPLAIVKVDDLADFERQLKVLQINGHELMRIFELQQRRRRVYISKNGQALATVTLDSASVNKWWISAKLTEIEIELNEINYTDANATKRLEMDQFSKELTTRITQKFNYLLIDQTPKYNKMYQRLKNESSLFEKILRFEFLFN